MSSEIIADIVHNPSIFFLIIVCPLSIYKFKWKAVYCLMDYVRYQYRDYLDSPEHMADAQSYHIQSEIAEAE